MPKENIKKKEQEDGIKYCVCAMIDLLGFSSHLENASEAIFVFFLSTICPHKIVCN